MIEICTSYFNGRICLMLSRNSSVSWLTKCNIAWRFCTWKIITDEILLKVLCLYHTSPLQSGVNPRSQYHSGKVWYEQQVLFP
ncbi:hypothetical protein MTR67_037095 [Solanum verrucosum]|uniref:Uncharacterized protein n=1 Tax=Solanum verrucosum TaxID=315347 RepID=A0AAF0UDA9_SOLVR|nr:hypothetical protein MTR67_037095 [Solanum verrucosum]